MVKFSNNTIDRNQGKLIVPIALYPNIRWRTCGFLLCENADLSRQAVSTPQKLC
jgi:hypothetical protein